MTRQRIPRISSAAVAKAGLPTLVAAGFVAGSAVTGQPRDLPTRVDLAAHRIIQESLTNVIRHARAATARIAIACQTADVVIQIDDDGRGADEHRLVPGDGDGLPGMRERASALDGELEAGPQAACGSRVLVRLPIHGAA